MARSRRLSRRPSRPLRRYEWARYFDDISIDLTGPRSTTNFTNMLTSFEQVLGADAAGTTVTRIRGHLVTWFAAAEGTTLRDMVNVPLGIRVATDPPAGQTNEQLVEILSQEYADWMYYDTLFVPPLPAASTFTNSFAVRQDIDIKSQRRFDELQQSLYFITGAPGGAAGTLEMKLYLNILLKMP